jgi:two-component system, cell cycle sensor histidine kinase and response regulator CckA
MEALLMSSREPFVNSKQLEATGRVSPVVAHDINNLLSGILGYAQILLSDPAIGHLKPYIDEMLGAGKRIAALTRILLVFSHRHTEFAEVLDLSAAIQEMEKYIPHIVGPGIHFSSSRAPGLWPVLADATQIRRALFAIAIDVRDKVPDGGELHLKIENRELEQDGIPETAQDPKRYVCITAEITASLPKGLIASDSTCSLSHEASPSRERISGIADIDEMVRSCGGFISTGNANERALAMQIFLPAALKTER